MDGILITGNVTADGRLVAKSAPGAINLFEDRWLLAGRQLLGWYLLLVHHRGVRLRGLGIIRLLLLLICNQLFDLLLVLEGRFGLGLL